MLKAKKSVLFEKIFAIYNRNLLKRRFSSFRVKNPEALHNRNKEIPLIIYANHSSWWDGLVLFEILKSREFDSFVLMEEKQLKELKLFRRIGAFSIIRENSKEAIQSLKYIIEVLSAGKNKTLLIFPQGEIFPNDKRPIEFYNGLSYLVQKLGKCDLLPCSIRYEFLGEFKPEIFVSFGDLQNFDESENFDRKVLTKSLEKKITENLDFLKTSITENNIEDLQRLF